MLNIWLFPLHEGHLWTFIWFVFWYWVHGLRGFINLKCFPSFTQSFTTYVSVVPDFKGACSSSITTIFMIFMNSTEVLVLHQSRYLSDIQVFPKFSLWSLQPEKNVYGGELNFLSTVSITLTLKSAVSTPWRYTKKVYWHKVLRFSRLFILLRWGACQRHSRSLQQCELQKKVSNDFRKHFRFFP